MKDFLKKLIESRNARIKEIRSAIEASTDVKEVRSLTSEAEKLQEEVRDAQAKLAEIEAEEARAAQDQQNNEQRDGVPANARMVNGNIVGSFGQAQNQAQTRDNVDPHDTLEYRQAFMAYVQNGTPMVTRAGEAISTTDAAPAIPLTIMNEVINTVRKRYGNLYNKVRHLNVKGGIQFPIGALQATFKWINESTVSPRQKLDPLAKVMFSYHVAEIRIAQTFLTSITTLEEFETKISEVIAIAYLEAMDQAIVKGTGNGMPLGILNDPRVTGQSANVIEMTAADINNWSAWRKKFFAKLPLGYRSGEFIFPLSTVETYLETMADANNNPVFRQATGLEVNDGDARNPNGRFFGREISLVEPDILPDFDAASNGDVIGIFWQPEEYALNENFGFTMRRWFDEETNEWVDKALVVVDGKVLNPVGYYLIKKKV